MCCSLLFHSRCTLLLCDVRNAEDKKRVYVDPSLINHTFQWVIIAERFLLCKNHSWT